MASHGPDGSRESRGPRRGVARRGPEGRRRPWSPVTRAAGVFGSDGRPAGGHEDRRKDDENEHAHDGHEEERREERLECLPRACSSPIMTTRGVGLLHADSAIDRIEHLFYSDPAPAAATAAPPFPSTPGSSMSSPALRRAPRAHRPSRSSTAPRRRRTSSARAVELGLAGARRHRSPGASTGSSGSPSAAEEAGLHPVVGVEVELVDALVPDPHGLVIPARRPGPAVAAGRPAARRAVRRPGDGLPARPQPDRIRLPGPPRGRSRRTTAASGQGSAARTSSCSPGTTPGTGASAGSSRGPTSPGRRRRRGSRQALLAEHAEGLVALSGCRHGELARRLLAGDREGARAVAEGYARALRAAGRATGRPPRGASPAPASSSSSPTTSCPATTGSSRRRPASPGSSACRSSSRMTSATPARRTASSTTCSRRSATAGRVETLAELRTPSGEHYLKSGAELAALPPGDVRRRCRPRRPAWREGIANAGELAAACRVDLGFEQYRFPGFPVPAGETAFSYLAELCHGGIRRRYHPVTPPVVKQLAHELDVIERTGLAEFFLICWDLMRFAKERRIPAQGRGSAADSIVAYVLGITRVDPIRHNLLFERFINEGRTTYPDVDIDFSSARREEVIQYVYERYGAEHTGMVCNLVTYRARSAVREVGYRAGVPAPARGPRGEGARDLRLGDGPPRPRGRRRLRRVLPAARRAEPELGAAAGSAARAGDRGLVDAAWASSTTPGAAGSGPAAPARRARPAGRADDAARLGAGRAGGRSASRTAGPPRPRTRRGAATSRGPDPRRRSGPAAPPTTRAAPATPRRASPGSSGAARRRRSRQSRGPCAVARHRPRRASAEPRHRRRRCDRPPPRHRPRRWHRPLLAGGLPASPAATRGRGAPAQARRMSRTPRIVRQRPSIPAQEGMEKQARARRTAPAHTEARRLVMGVVPAAERPGASRRARQPPCRAPTATRSGPGPGRRGPRVGSPGTVDGRPLDPESGVLAPPARNVDRLGRPRHCDPPPAPGPRAPAAAGPGRPAAGRPRDGPGPLVGRPPRARAAAPAARGEHRRDVALGALAGAVRPDRRLPPPPLDPHRRDARDGRPAHRHRPARAGDDARPGRRPVRQARRRDPQAHQARPARPRDARRDRRDASSSSSTTAPSASTSTAFPRRSRRSSRCSRRPTPSASSRSRAGPRCRRSRSRGRPASTTSSWRSRSSGRARSRATPSTRTCAASRASSR